MRGLFDVRCVVEQVQGNDKLVSVLPGADSRLQCVHEASNASILNTIMTIKASEAAMSITKAHDVRRQSHPDPWQPHNLTATQTEKPKPNSTSITKLSHVTPVYFKPSAWAICMNPFYLAHVELWKHDSRHTHLEPSALPSHKCLALPLFGWSELHHAAC